MFYKSILKNYGYAIVFSMIFLFLIFKCRYGYANMDESFYLTIPYRLCLGDGLLVHEWHLSQLSAFLLYPLVRVYLWIFHSTEGILLNFRYLFTFIWASAALFVNYRLSSYSKIGAHIASLSFLIYTPFGIMALSYNSLGILTLLCACVIIMTAQTHIELQYTLGGILSAFSILCCPFNLGIYIIFSIVALLFWHQKRHGQLLRCWLFVTLGSLIVLCFFSLFLFSRCSLNKLLSSIPWILNDPEHSGISLITKIKVYVLGIIQYRFPIYIYLASALFVVTGRLKKDWRPYCFAGVCVCCSMYILGFEMFHQYLNYLMWPITILGFYCAVTSTNVVIKRLFWCLWVPGMLYGFFLNMAPNQVFYAISSAATIATVSSIVMAAVYASDMANENKAVFSRKIMITCLAVVFALQIGTEVHLRYTSVFWEPESMAAQTVCAESGPEKGILMTPEKEALCQNIQTAVSYIKDDEQIEKVLFASNNTEFYLYAEKELSTYSAWLSGVNSHSLNKLDAYYKINPDKIPDAVYLESSNKEFYDYFIDKGYSPESYGSYFYMRKSS